MTITSQDELDGLKVIGRIVANTMHCMAAAMEPGMTTRELDWIGRDLLDREGAGTDLRLCGGHLHQHQRGHRARHPRRYAAAYTLAAQAEKVLEEERVDSAGFKYG